MNLLILLTTTLLLASFSGFSSEIKDLRVECYLPGRSLLFEIQASVAPSDPNLHVEDHVLDGEIHLTSDYIRGSRRGIRVVGTYDNSRVVKRISVRPNAVQQFSVFRNISITESTNGRQLVNINSSQTSLSGVSAGSFCKVHI